MSVIWRLAEQLHTVPMAADEIMRLRSGAWWASSRSFGCIHAKDAHLWFVVFPRPDILCGVCALHLLSETSACLYCMEPVEKKDGEHVVHESTDYLVFLSVAHVSCVEAFA